MAVLSELEPNKVFKYFEEICSIPHGSNNVKQISDYLVDFAKAHNLKYRQDDDLNWQFWMMKKWLIHQSKLFLQ